MVHTSMNGEGLGAGAERHLRHVIDTAGDAYVAVDAEGQVTEWNRAAVNTFGWSRADAIGRSLTDLIVPPDLVHHHTRGFTRYQESGEPRILGTPTEVSARHRSGAIFPVEITVWEVAEGASRGFHAFLRDITLRKAAEERLQQSNEDLQAFAAMAAHDLRSPLSVASVSAALLAEQVEDGPVDSDHLAKGLDRIRRAADRGAALIDDLLAYVSIGGDSLEVGPVDLTELAEAAATESRDLAAQPVSVEVLPLPVIDGSLPLLRQLLSNLIGNAVKYAPQGHQVTITIDAVPGRSEDWVTLRVTDNGAPIAPADRERIFGIFERGGNCQVPGSGVGLAICQRVAVAHGGQVGLDPDYDTGNRFCIELPTWRPRL